MAQNRKKASDKVWLSFQVDEKVSELVMEVAREKFEGNRSQAGRYLVRLGLEVGGRRFLTSGKKPILKRTRKGAASVRRIIAREILRVA